MQDSFHSKYKYIRSLGHGGCGEVFLAQNTVLGNFWAVKEITKGKEAAINGYNEPEILKRLNHPALPRICDLYEDEDKIYIVEDYIEGVCLKQALDENGKFDEPVVLDWAIQLCSVLEYIHSQSPYAIIYGDMKPHNIILTKEGFVKIVDFGISALIPEKAESLIGTQTEKASFINIEDYHNNDTGKGEDLLDKDISNSKAIGKLRDNSTQDKARMCLVSDNMMEYEKQISDKQIGFGRETVYETAFIGTKGYAAPEQFIGNGISKSSDIYALGITIIQLLTGLDPLTSINDFQNESYAHKISSGLYEILRKCINPNPKLRYKSAGTLMKDLREYSLRYYAFNENHVLEAKGILDFTKIILVTGARGTGVSTITAAMAECLARGPTRVCVVDLSTSARLGDSIYQKNTSSSNNKEKRHSNNLSKVNSNLYYINFNHLKENIICDNLILHRQLGQLQQSFSYIIIDVDITFLKALEQYSNHIYIVSDMNPFNLSEINQVMKSGELARTCISRTSFIINKFCTGELSPRSILQGILLTSDVPNELQELIAYAKAFEVPYEQKVYIKWVYSFFGEALSFQKSIDEKFLKSIQNIISSTISKEKRKESRFAFSKLISKVLACIMIIA
ncbi:serine/threonine-protein kinase [Ruminiclostridium herbifermentans]|uniref:serine/threonine-protein kinase n=1 Tax=Ruminiclostridium herbifermentans TaxID=2488810 RepID=UPI001FD620BF|nr:serine/threonine-protein kinase [Ruminiclostridium herbifermentans]